jgi:hypothetical protein
LLVSYCTLASCVAALSKNGACAAPGEHQAQLLSRFDSYCSRANACGCLHSSV